MFKLSYTDTVTLKVLVFSAIAVFSIPYYFSAGGTLLGFILIRVIGSLMGGIAHIGSHRWLCHNSFKPSIFGKYLMLTGMVMNGHGSPLQIGIAHRLHHAHTDTKNDPHSPMYHSWFSLWLGRYTINSGIKIPKDFFKNKEAVFVSKHYWKLFYAFNIILALIDLKTALFFSPVNFAYSWIIITAVNYNTHKKNEVVEARNLNSVFNFISYGEGLHKNHHEDQTNYSFSGGTRFDLGAVIVEKLLMHNNQRTTAG